MGTTTNATEILEPAIPTDYDRKMTHFELQNSAKAASLAENLLLGNLNVKQISSADHKPEPLALLYWNQLGFSLPIRKPEEQAPCAQ